MMFEIKIDLKKIARLFLLKPVCKYGILVTGFLWLFFQDGAAQNLLIEAEDFQFKGGWILAKEPGVSGTGGFTVVSTPANDALTVIKINKEAKYNVWVRTRDFPNQSPGTRLSRLSINDEQLAEQGKHGRDGYYWEKVGAVSLVKGESVIKIHDTKMNHARVDAILLSGDDAFNPNDKAVADLAVFRVMPSLVRLMEDESENSEGSVSSEIPSGSKEVRRIGNDKIRLSVLQPTGNAGGRLFTKIEGNIGGQWISLDSRQEDSRISLISTDKTGVSYSSFVPSWSSTQQSKKYILLNGKKHYVLGKDDATNPFMAGVVTRAIPMKIKAASGNTLEIEYKLSDNDALTALWNIRPGATHVDLSVTYTTKKAGYYSIAVEAFNGVDSSLVSNVQLPPLYQYQRLPAAPTLVPLALSPQPLSIVEIKTSANLPVSFFITGDPEQFSRQWAAYDFGLGLKGIDNKVQPVAFSPIIGLEGSHNNKGVQITRSFKLGMAAVGWDHLLHYISDSIFQVKDYRKQSTPLTKSFFNIIDLMKNDTASGWSAKRKGFLDIESDPAKLIEVAQPSPLTVLSAAVLTNDEDLYIKRALPIIEFTLSRKGYRWGIPPPQSANKQITEFNPFKSQFNTAYYEGLNALLGNKNPWIKDIAMPDGKPRYSGGYGTQEGWTGDLAAYKLTKDNEWLSLAKEKANTFIFQEVLGQKNKILSHWAFYNVSSYPPWFDLMDLYDITGDAKYLTAAKYAAFFTIAGIRSYPLVKNEPQVIHPGGKYVGNSRVFWREDKPFKLGYPRIPGDMKEKTVLDVVVSPVGLGIEQPATYFNDGKGVQNVYMSSWAPSLLRLTGSKGDDIFNIYARNAVVGRFTNYPGYYAAGYTDVVLDSIYPYKGPDVTSIYYHHLPAHLSFLLDFLITEAVQRSNGTITFPYSRQNGFVWFSNRIYGTQQGNIGNKKVSLFLRKRLIQIDEPEINYLTAISDDSLYLVLLNESNNAIAANIKTNNSGGYIAANKISKQVPAKGIAIVTVPLLKKYSNAADGLKPVKNGMKIVDLGKSFGRLFLYRIRSPFGWDSVFGFVDQDFNVGGSARTASLSLEQSSGNNDKGSFPYEWSFLKIGTEEKVDLVFLVKEGAKVLKELKIKM
ncbi:hypothetical protein [Niabella aquatica]